jgi:hypothetical protein
MSQYRKYVALALAAMFAISLLVLVMKVVHSRAKVASIGPSRICQTCGRSLPYEGAKCGYCDFQKRMAELNLPGRPQVVDHELTPVGRIGIAAGILGFLTMLAYLPEIRHLRREWIRRKEETFVLRCKKCKRKLRYFASSAGKQGACPGCRETMMFPELGSSEAVLA